MKILSILLNILLAVPFLHYAILSVRFYDDANTFHEFGLDEPNAALIYVPYITMLVIYLVSFKIAAFLNFTRRFAASAVFSGVMIVAYAVIVIFKLIK